MGFQILTFVSSPADANTVGSLGCHAILLTQPGCASRASIMTPLDRQMYMCESNVNVSQGLFNEDKIITYLRFR